MGEGLVVERAVTLLKVVIRFYRSLLNCNEFRGLGIGKKGLGIGLRINV